MKKMSILLTIALLLTAMTAPPAIAAETEWEGADLLSGEFGKLSTAAEVDHGFLCGIGFNTTTNSQCTLSNSGNETLQCHGALPATIAPPPTPVRFVVLCGLCFSGLTIGLLTVNPSGAISLKCQN